MENFLQDLRIGHKPPTGSNQPLEDHLGVCFMRVGGSDQVHRDIRIDEDQPL
jgi:hypothetical protein